MVIFHQSRNQRKHNFADNRAIAKMIIAIEVVAFPPRLCFLLDSRYPLDSYSRRCCHIFLSLSDAFPTLLLQ